MDVHFPRNVIPDAEVLEIFPEHKSFINMYLEVLPTAYATLLSFHARSLE